MKKLMGFFVALVAVIVMPTVVEAADVMPEAVDGRITLTENVTLTSPYVLTKSSTLTIDLNGYTLTGPENGYLIDSNFSSLTIVDSGETKGKIACTAKQSSCIRIFGGATVIDGVTIESPYIGVKVEGLSKLDISNSKVTAWTPMQTAGDTTVNSCELISVDTSYGPQQEAIYALTFSKRSHAVVEVSESTLEGTSALMYEKYAGEGFIEPKVTIEGGVINAENFKAESTERPTEGESVVKGTIEAPVSALPYAEAGTEFVINNQLNVNETITKPEGVTLYLHDEEFGKKVLVDNGDGTATVKESLDTTEYEKVEAKFDAIKEEEYTEESLKKVEAIFLEVIEELEKLNYEKSEQAKFDELVKKLDDSLKLLVKKTDATKNPNTGDNIITYVALGLVSLTAIGLVVKFKKFD